jgi:TolB-like protein
MPPFAAGCRTEMGAGDPGAPSLSFSRTPMHMGESRSPSAGNRLNSWKEIAAHLQRDVRTVQRWEKNEGLPVHRKLHDTLSSVYAYASELEEWWRGGSSPASATLAAPSQPLRPTLAVLPLRNLSGDSGQDYFSDGLTEELIGQLGRLIADGLGVIARVSAMRYKDSSKGIEQIARELRAGYAIEGSVRRDDDRVRISVALVRVADQSHLWSESYDRSLRDILTLQAQVARAVATHIPLHITALDWRAVVRTGLPQASPPPYPVEILRLHATGRER